MVFRKVLWINPLTRGQAIFSPEYVLDITKVMVIP